MVVAAGVDVTKLGEAAGAKVDVTGACSAIADGSAITAGLRAAREDFHCPVVLLVLDDFYLGAAE